MANGNGNIMSLIDVERRVDKLEAKLEEKIDWIIEKMDDGVKEHHQQDINITKMKDNDSRLEDDINDLTTAVAEIKKQIKWLTYIVIGLTIGGQFAPEAVKAILDAIK